jgi:magnesium transporter
MADSDLDMFPKMLKLVDTSYSHLRTGDAFTFVLKSILDFSEDYVKIIDAYEAAIEMLDRKLTLLKTKLSENDVRLIQRSARHLSKLRRTVRPLMAVVEVLSLQKDWGGESVLYISDIKSNLSRFLSDSLALIETAEFLRANYLKYGQSRTGNVLYVLMLVTTVFTPAEFIATLYGMNFADPKDTSRFAAPELNWKFGYLYFWGLVSVFVFCLFSLYRKKRWI